MDAASHVRKTALPGVGVRYDLDTQAGKHLSVVVHQDGRRTIGFHDPADDESCKETVTLAPQEATALGQVLLPDSLRAVRSQVEIDLVTERIPITKQSAYGGRTLGETRARTLTGASIVAVLRRTGAFPSPAPDFRFAIGDTLVVVGTREGVNAVSTLIAGG
ncbi:cation:proton antiporter regulatory subunit [Streptomyces sp. TS71-3]|uniref:cation:proton antiporter regulatory subunit n=1 Tax=Streptomyces sp. TS71-3 TaxID=2733862 RepID=UPI001B117BBA|nr:cation:proton antiporter regulatory subunit [Streptomyces sp. TS71-3]GHJ41190.1 potassium transporter TrkA [Streptomyces sp. TS71-3]